MDNQEQQIQLPEGFYELEPPEMADNSESAKETRCEDFWYKPDVPRSFFENTSKEELVLEHVFEYQR